MVMAVKRCFGSHTEVILVLDLVPFNGQVYKKQKGPKTSNQLLFRLQNKFRKIHLLVIYMTKFEV